MNGKWMDIWIGRCEHGRIDGRVDSLTDGWMDGPKGGSMDVWIHGSMDQWAMDR